MRSCGLWATMILGLCAQVVPGCSSRADREEEYYAYLSTHRYMVVEEVVPYDVAITWRWIREGVPWSEDNGMMIWNGEEVGRGAEGILKVLRRMRDCPPGTRILRYPWQNLEGEALLVPRTDVDMMQPYVNYMELMDDIVVARGLVLIDSYYYKYGDVLTGRTEQ